jgi:translation initiation factor IF-2
MGSYRISKILGELNIGLDTASDFLKEKGHDALKNRNAKIDQDQYDALVDQFASDKSKKVKAEELIEQKRIEREAIAAAREAEQEAKESAKEVAKAAEVAKAEAATPEITEKIDLSPKTVAKAEVKAEPEAVTKAPAKPDEVIKVKAKVAGLKVAGKIDLDALKKPASKAKGKAAAKPAPESAAAPSKPEASKAVKPEAESKPEMIEHTTVYQKLTGPKVVGDKIDLTKFETKPSEGKRKRIVKEGLRGPAAGGGRTTTGAASIGGRRGPQQRGPGKKPSGPVKEVSKEDIQKKIRETMARMSGGRKSKGSKIRRDKRAERAERREIDQIERAEGDMILKLTEFVTLMEVANMMKVPVPEVISACMSLGIMASMNQRLDKETLTVVADEFGFEVEFVDEEMQENLAEVADDTKDLEPRSPIVTVMGHVDHGKTSLLDYIREANVIAGEAGGITQHIGAYDVELKDGQHITFLDTPGHEAFTAMRARGAQVTDVAIIVVSADDDVMPQTKEAISHAQAAGVPIVFAINKIDRPDANPEKIKEQLSAMNLLVEDWGGKIQSQDVSAKLGTNVDKLLEKVLLEAELLELKANPNREGRGTVIESTLDKGRGYVTSLLVQNGSFKVGDYILAGQYSGKVRAMMDERGNKMAVARPSKPVSILGLDGAPSAGDSFNIMTDEREAKAVATKRQQMAREQSVRSQKKLTLDEIGRRLAVGDFQELNIVLKGDVNGSIEALTDSLQRLTTEEIQVNIIHKGVGGITESDVLLAAASDAIIIGFQVRPTGTCRKLAEKEEVEIRLYSIIYDAINEVKEAMTGMLSPDMKEEIVCNLEIREVFKISKFGTIAGCMVTDGVILRNTTVRIIRDSVVIYTGELGSLKRFKDEVKEVKKGMECGLNINNFNDIKVGDVIEGYKQVEVQREL